MRICPYLSFNGNCAEVVAHYEKAFNVKATVMRYSDAPPSEGYQPPPGAENHIMHAQLEVGGAALMLCDMPPQYPVKTGDHFGVMVEFDSPDAAKAAFEVLREGGEVEMELQKTFWSECFGSLTDKFGVAWNISIGCPAE